MLVKIKSTDLNDKSIKIVERINNFKNLEFIVTCLEIQPEDFKNYGELYNKFKSVFDIFYANISDNLVENESESLTELLLESALYNKRLYLNWESKEGRDFCTTAKDFYKSEHIEIIHDYTEKISGENLIDTNLKVFAEVFDEIVNGTLITTYSHTLEIENDNLNLTNNFNKDNENLKINIKEFDLKWKDVMLKVKRELVSFDEYLINNYYDYPFTLEVYEPIFDFNEGRIKDILDHKWKMFEFVSTLKYEDVLELPQEIILKLNENEFIPFNQILEIVEGDYPFLKYYKEMEGII